MKKILGLSAVFVVVAGFIFAPRLTKKSYIKVEGKKEEALHETRSPQPAGLSIGDIAPDFKLKNVDGRTVSLAQVEVPAGTNLEGYIVAFTCNTCPYAVMYEDRLIELHNKMAPQGWPVVAIQPNDPGLKPGDSFEEMKVRANEKDFPFVYLFDEGQKVYPQYGATRTPHIFLLEKNRKVRYIGAIDNNPQDAEAVTEPYVENAIAAIKAGKEPNPNFTKAIGCGIKAK